MDSFVSQGLPLDPDMFSTGETPHGAGHVVRTVYEGLRTTGADFLLNEKEQVGNIKIKTDTSVNRVVLEGDTASGLRATAVQVQGADGIEHTYFARKEIVISCGAYCSPAVLLRSGIGPKEELAKHGIECLVDLPGVGKNLMDHLVGTQSGRT
jgi:choline dehydrogenase-like flavoprotein